jgi:hypothetical protein
MKNIFFSDEGDFLIRDNKIKIAKESNNEALLNTILHRIQTRPNDWKIENRNIVEFYNISMEDFISNRVSKEVIQAIKFFLVSILTEDRLLRAEDIVIYDLPINHNILFLKMSILSKDRENGPIFVNINYDIRSNRLIPKIVNVPEKEIWQN